MNEVSTRPQVGATSEQSPSPIRPAAPSLEVVASEEVSPSAIGAAFSTLANLLRQAAHTDEPHAYSGNSDRLLNVAADLASAACDNVPEPEDAERLGYDIAALVIASRNVRGDTSSEERNTCIAQAKPLLAWLTEASDVLQEKAPQLPASIDPLCGHTPAQARLIFERIASMAGTALEVMVATNEVHGPQLIVEYIGVRTSELIALTWADIDLQAGTVRVHRAVVEGEEKGTKTRAGVRTIPLLLAARQALEDQRQRTEKVGGRVFMNPRNDKEWTDQSLLRLWQRTCKKAMASYRNPYQMRHTFASQLLSQGENPAYIAKLLGHKTTEMVIRNYGRWVEQGATLGFDRPQVKYGREHLPGLPEVGDASDSGANRV